MKKLSFLVLLLLAVMFHSCKIGSQSVSSGLADESFIAFYAPQKYDIKVDIDGVTYDATTIKNKEWRNDRNIKATVKERIKITPGKHEVTVTKGSNVLYKRTIFVSTNDYKIIDL